jgi:DNA-directed RNA polymerase subunit RPC12/RpoP
VKRFVGQGVNRPFTCAECGADVLPLVSGGYRNHCPYCLCSLHVDVNPGDRANDCGGVMEPVGAELTGKKGWVVVHRCRRCGEVRRNKAALEDPRQPDDVAALARVAAGAVPHRM